MGDVQHKGSRRDTVTVTAPVPYSAAPSFDYIPSLDGLRAASIALVVAGHTGFKHYLPGGFGVTVFFFVSGFLITRQTLAEQATSGQLSLHRFYLRRLLRLYPALLVALAVGGVVFTAFGGSFPPGQIAAGVFYFTNYYMRFSPYAGVPDGMYNPFAILWSLAVEEHYYLVFPALALLFARTRVVFALVLCGLIAVVTLWRFHVAGECSAMLPQCIGDGFHDRILQGTDTRIDSILYGAVLATLLGTRFAEPLLEFLRNRAVFWAGIVILGLSIAIRDQFFRDSGRFTFQGVGLFLATGSLLFSERLGWVRSSLSWPGAVLLGRWSYSLYLWHSIVLLCVVSIVPDAIWRRPLVDGQMTLLWNLVCVPPVLILSLSVAMLSYTYIEMPMVALRRRFGSHATHGGTPASPPVTPKPALTAY